jgi:hypothetical protein
VKQVTELRPQVMILDMRLPTPAGSVLARAPGGPAFPESP